MTQDGRETGVEFDPEAIERVALQIGARLRRYHVPPSEAGTPPRLIELLRELERAERRL